MIAVGDKFNSWTVKEKITDGLYICICKCGTEKIIKKHILNNNPSKHCWLCHAKQMSDNVEDLTGRTFGKWKVLYRHINPKYHQAVWSCLCEKCGKVSIVRATHLKTGRSKHCIKCNWHQQITATMWNSLKSNAKLRKIPFEITPEEAWELWLNQNGKCAISGVELNLPFNKRDKATASLDRIDSAKSYSKDNCQWVHKIINMMKNTLCTDDVISIAYNIINTHKINPNTAWHLENYKPKGYVT